MKDDFDLKEVSKIYKEAMEVGTPSPLAVQRATDIVSRDQSTSAFRKVFAFARAGAFLAIRTCRKVFAFEGVGAVLSTRTFRRAFMLAGAGAFLFILLCSIYLSADAHPNTLLYPVKQNYEQVQIAFALNQMAKLELHLEFAEERIREVEQVRGDTSAELLALEGYKIQLARVSEIVSSTSDEVSHQTSAKVEEELADNVEELEEMAANAPPQSQAKIAQAIASQTTVALLEEYAARHLLTAQPISSQAQDQEDQDSNQCADDEDDIEFDDNFVKSCD